jgi:two-component system, OmpR family, alkaline phosphatase synthesis response regulator PhoP
MAQKKILIIDDDPDITLALQMILEKENYMVIARNNKDGFADLISNEKPDLIILDVMMENMSDGFEISVEIKKNKAFSKIPILLYTGIDKATGVNFKSAYGQTENINADGYLEKPVSSKELLTEVNRLLSLSK